MANLVTCESIGNALAEWLNNATPEQLGKFCELLSCPINVGGSGSGLTGSGTPDDPLRIDLSEDNGNIIELRENGLFGKPKISAQGGNLIQEREDGIYYGQEAAPDVRDLYVDAQNGNDSNTGKRDAPLRSIREALTRQVPYTKFFINLKEGQIFEWKSSWGFWDNYIPTFSPYGEASDKIKNEGTVLAQSGYAVQFQPTFVNRPTIKFVGDREWKLSSGSVDNASVIDNTTGADAWTFNGIIFDCRYTPTYKKVYWSNAFLGRNISKVNVTFHACSMIGGTVYALVEMGKDSEITFGNFWVDEPGKPVIIISQGVLSLIFGNIQPIKEGTPTGDAIPSEFRPALGADAFGQLIEGITQVSTANVNTKASLGSTL